MQEKETQAREQRLSFGFSRIQILSGKKGRRRGMDRRLLIEFQAEANMGRAQGKGKNASSSSLNSSTLHFD